MGLGLGLLLLLVVVVGENQQPEDGVAAALGGGALTQQALMRAARVGRAAAGASLEQGGTEGVLTCSFGVVRSGASG